MLNTLNPQLRADNFRSQMEKRLVKTQESIKIQELRKYPREEERDKYLTYSRAE